MRLPNPARRRQAEPAHGLGVRQNEGDERTGARSLSPGVDGTELPGPAEAKHLWKRSVGQPATPGISSGQRTTAAALWRGGGSRSSGLPSSASDGENRAFSPGGGCSVETSVVASWPQLRGNSQSITADPAGQAGGALSLAPARPAPAASKRKTFAAPQAFQRANLRPRHGGGLATFAQGPAPSVEICVEKFTCRRWATIGR